MNKILKSYLKTFFKNWISTLGTFVFLAVLTAMLIGMLATPLQIKSNIKKVENGTVKYDYVMKNKTDELSTDFFYKYLIHEQDYKNSEGEILLEVDPIFKNSDETFFVKEFSKELTESLVQQSKITYYNQFDKEIKTEDIIKWSENPKKVLEALDWIANENTYLLNRYMDKNYWETITMMVPNIHIQPNDPGEDQYKKSVAKLQECLTIDETGKIIEIKKEFWTILKSQEYSPFGDKIFFEKEGEKYPFNTFGLESAKNIYWNGIEDEIAFLLWKLDHSYDTNSSFAISIETIQNKLRDKDSKEYYQYVNLVEEVASMISKLSISGNDTFKEIVYKSMYELFFSESSQNIGSVQIQEKIIDIIKKSFNDDMINWLNDESLWVIDEDFDEEIENSNQTMWTQNLAFNIPVSFILTNEFKKILYEHNDSFAYYVAKTILGKNNDYAVDWVESFGISKKNPSSIGNAFSTDVYATNSDDQLNQIVIYEGEIARQWENNDYLRGILPEIVLSPTYAKAHNIKVGDVITVDPMVEDKKEFVFENNKLKKYFTGKIDFRVSGIGLKYDNLQPGRSYSNGSQELGDYTYSYIDKNFFEQLWSISERLTDSETRLKMSSDKIIIKENNGGSLEDAVSRFAYDYSSKKNVGIFEQDKHLIRDYIKSDGFEVQKMINIQITIFIILGTAVLLLGFIFINFIIKQEMNSTRRQLGIFKAFGYKTSELSWIFALKTWIIITVAVLIGYGISVPIQNFAYSVMNGQLLVPLDAVYTSSWFLILIFIGIPVMFLLVSYLLTLRHLSESPLNLINSKTKIPRKIKKNLLVRYSDRKNIMFDYRLRNGFIKSSKGKFITVQVLFAMSSLVYALMFGAQVIIDQLIMQNFIKYDKDIDHDYTYRGITEDVMSYDSQNTGYKYNQDFYNDSWWRSIMMTNYIDYKDKTLNQALDESPNSSDSRYATRLLMDSISNSIQTADDKLQYILPYEIVEIIAMYLSGGEINFGEINLSGIQDWFIRYVFGYRIIDQNNPLIFNEENNNGFTKNQWLKEQIDLLKSNDQVTTNIEDLKQQEELFIDFSNTETAALYFQQTLGGLGVRSSLWYTDPNGMKSSEESLITSFYLSDFIKFASLLIATEYALEQINYYLKDLDRPYSKEDIKNAYDYVNEQIYCLDYYPKNQEFWNLFNNPFTTLPQPQNRKVGIDLNKVDDGFKDLFLTSMFTDLSNESIHTDKIILQNQIAFDSNNESLAFVKKVKNKNEDTLLNDAAIKAMDFSTNIFGNPENNYNFDGVSESAMNMLKSQPTQYDLDNEIVNGIIPYAIAEYNDYKVGDIIPISFSYERDESGMNIRVVGINEVETFNIGDAPWNIFVDYQAMSKVLFNGELQNTALRAYSSEAKDYLDNGIFNQVVSNKEVLKSDLNPEDIINSLTSFEFTGDYLSIFTVDTGGALLYSYLVNLLPNVVNELIGEANIKTNKSTYMLATNPLSLSSYRGSTNQIALMKEASEIMSKLLTQLLLVTLLIQTLLMIIILSVLVNLIIEESSVIILTMKSIGYKNWNINWIVMGSYIIGAMISFVLMYIFANIVWQIAAVVVASELGFFVTIPFDWQTFLILFTVIMTILLAGWWTSSRRVNKHQITTINSLE